MAALKRDPIIQKMAEDVRGYTREELASADGTPRFEFMRAALKRYQELGGEIGTHIGGPAEAILELLSER